jgi:uncharacterized protein (TIGR03437 family)
MGALVSPARAAACSGQLNVGYQVLTLPSGLKTAIWYPTTDSESAFTYEPGLAGSVAKNGAIANCSTPLVLFSHGYWGCGLQSVFFTEQLARQGYVVAAPDHQDAAVCSVDGAGSFNFGDTADLFLNPSGWTDATYSDRRDDIETLINYLLASPDFGPAINASEIGMSGHSLGGYTALGVVGAWPSWKDSRIGPALAFSPYLLPFLENSTLPGMGVPVMYQGGQLDILTPTLVGKSGAYAESAAPKYFEELFLATHVSWTNLVCFGFSTISSCLRYSPTASSIDNYGIDFFDRYLKGIPEPLLNGRAFGVVLYEHMGTLNSVSAASYGNAVAPNSIVSGFGDVATTTASATQTPLPTTLGDVSITVTDAAGTTRSAPLFFVSPGQVNFLIPDGSQSGAGSVSVSSEGNIISGGPVNIAAVAPAIFSANGQGNGVAAGQYLRVSANGTQTGGDVFSANGAAIPVSLGAATDQVYLILYGTGMRLAGAISSAAVGGVRVPVAGLAPQPQYTGLDQVNLGPLPRSLVGYGPANVVVSLNGIASNPVSVTLQ